MLQRYEKLNISMNRTIKFAASKVHNIDESEKNAYLSNELTIHNYNRPLDKHQVSYYLFLYSFSMWARIY